MQTAVLYPGMVFGTCFILNFFIWKKSSSGAVPFTTMLYLLLIWSCISLPLVYLGYYIGYKKPAIQNPVRTNQIPRQIPEQLWYMNPFFTYVSVVLCETDRLLLNLNSMWFMITVCWSLVFYHLERFSSNYFLSLRLFGRISFIIYSDSCSWSLLY